MSTVSDIQRAQLREARRELRRRQVRRRRAVAGGVVFGCLVLGIVVAKIAGSVGVDSVSLQPAPAALAPSPFHSQLPDEIRGVHVTMALASLPGKLAQYVALKKDGLNTIELDVKDENGHVGFLQGIPSLARADGA
ncbi:MAG: hypothetical protein JOZ56_07025, partial [Actinobacteria bacterium]|nr:hypothetical protein [Actinomycetota bacterium]